jgi:hypothetical protein
MRWIGLLSAVLCSTQMYAQENSPYSRYGVGDLVPSRNIATRGMGGISAGYSDYQVINFVNPASYANISNTIFDVGAEVDIRTLKSINPAKKFTNTNSLFSYLQLGVPIGSKKMAKKQTFMGLVFGLRPLSRINYKIERNSRLAGVDSLNTLFEGSGGINQAYVGIGFRKKNFSIGFNGGYMFGNREYSTRLTLINDSVEYYRSNSANTTSYGGLFLNIGTQYEIPLKKENSSLRFGAFANLGQNMNALRDVIRETFVYDANSNNNFRVDSVFIQREQKGTITMPISYGVGFTYSDPHWVIGADYESTNWSAYRYYGEKDFVRNNWMIRAGAQYFPATVKTPVKKYFNFVKYRAGFYYGPNYVNITEDLPEYGFTFGAGFPLTSLRRSSYYNDLVTLNAGIEVGNRGKSSSGLRESITRISVGIAMNARWFVKSKYD